MSRASLRWTVLATTVAIMPAWAGEGSKPMSVHEFEMNSIDGKPIKLSTYDGKVMLLVNVASK